MDRSKENREYYLKNRDRILARKRARDADNREHNREYSRQYRLDNKERLAEYDKEWSSNNRGKKNAASARRRALLLEQTSENANHIWIDLIYEHCPEGHEVDHIIPLSKGGEHHEDNLQYLLMHDNRVKYNKIEGSH